MTARIVVVGSFNVDLTSYMARMPRPGETVIGRRFVTGPGGKGSNQAVAAARLGAEVTFVGRVGQDVFAPIALDLWRAEGIDARYVVQDPTVATGVAPIFVDDGGENSIVVVLGANLAVTPADVDAATNVIAGADALLVQLEIDNAATARALQVARDHGVLTVLNPAPAPPAATAVADLVALADFVTPNETELAGLTGRSSGTLVERASTLLSRVDQTVVVTLGGRGARYVRTGETAVVPPIAVDVVDTTGAGDAFTGGLAVALAEGRVLPDAVRFANATAALCVTQPGTAPAMPVRAAVDALIAANPTS